MVPMSMRDDREVIEPEVLPPERNGDKATPTDVTASVRWSRLASALLYGLILDAADFSTWFPPLGLVFGALIGWYICRSQGVPVRQWIWWIAASTLYCAIPRTNFFPLATLVLLYRMLTKKTE